MKNIKPMNYAKAKKLSCDWTDRKDYLIHCRILKIHIRHGMIVNKNHEIFSFKQTMWLAKYINFNTQKRNMVKIVFENDFYKILNKAFYGKTMEIVRNHLGLEFIKKYE